MLSFILPLHVGGKSIFAYACFCFSSADSGRFSIQGSNKSHTARLSAGESILRRYEADLSTLQVIDESTMFFKIQSTSTPTQWYHTSMQSSYCDCPDWTSNCKHLYGIRLIIQHHFPHLHAVLPIIDSVHVLGQMGLSENDQDMLIENEGLHIDVGSNNEHDNVPCIHDVQQDTSGMDAEIRMCIEEFSKVLKDIDNNLSSCDFTQKEIILQHLRTSKEATALRVPKEIHLPQRGSIDGIQAHVTLTRLGHGRPQKEKIAPIEDMAMPEKHGRWTGVLRRKHQRGRNRVRFEKRARIFCPHCCSKTLMIDPTSTHTCHTCHALLPLSRKHSPAGSEKNLVNKVVSLCDDLSVEKGVVTNCAYGLEEHEERHFSIRLHNGIMLQQIYASQQRIVLVYSS